MEEEHEDEPHYIKVVVIGDGFTGKTCLLKRMHEHDFPDGYVPTVYDNTSHTVFSSQGKPYEMDLWDTAGKEEFDRIRPLAYRETDVFLLCFAADSYSSLANLKDKWIPEIEHHGYDQVGYVIVQTKCDLITQRKRKELFEKMLSKHSSMLKRMLSEECAPHTNDRWMPTDLIQMVLTFAEYTDEEYDYDQRTVENLIQQSEIEKHLRTQLKFGLWLKEERVPFIETSALKGTNVDNNRLWETILKSYMHYGQPKKEAKKCLVQ